MDRLALSNPTLETVGGNVVSTGLGALEILGKRAVDVISDVVSWPLFTQKALLHWNQVIYLDSELTMYPMTVILETCWSTFTRKHERIRGL